MRPTPHIPPLPGPHAPYDPAAPWPCERGNPRNTGRSPIVRGDRGFARAEPMAWRRWSTGAGVFATPVVGADDTIQVGSADQHFYAFDPASGAQRATVASGGIGGTGCIAEDGTTWFATRAGDLHGVGPDGAPRATLSPGGGRAWQAGLALGADGGLFAGNDDDTFYALDRGGRKRWAHPTGMRVRTAPAFTDDGGVCFASFDLHLYLLDATTGALRWRADLGNLAASSPAIGPDGLIHLGLFDGRVLAIEPLGGTVVWSASTSGPILASPAIDEDGTVYVGSTDGCLHAIDRQGRVSWRFLTGAPIRGAAALGPDPEGRGPYLIHFGGGDGRIYALEPSGRRRWSLDTRALGVGADAAAIHAGVALGRTGLSTANAAGDVLFVPYHLHLDAPDTPGLCREPGDGFPADGALLYPVDPGGRLASAPLPAEPGDDAPERNSDPGQVLAFQAISRDGGRCLPVRIDLGSLDISVVPHRPVDAVLQPGGARLGLILEGPANAEPSAVSFSATFRDEVHEGELRGALRLIPTPTPASPPAIEALPGLPFDLTHLAVHDPAVTAGLDPLGLGSLWFHLRVIEVEPTTGRVVAWGLQHGRRYAFGGHYRDGHLVLEARGCQVEVAGFAVPLDRLRLSGTWVGAEGPSQGASLLVELDAGSRLRALNPLTTERIDLDAQPWRAPKPRDWSKLGGLVRSWVPGGNSLGAALPSAVQGASRSLALALRLPKRELYGPWGLIGDDGWFRGLGGFRTQAGTLAPPPKVRVEAFGYDPRNRQVVAELNVAGATREPPAFLPAILLVDRDQGAPVPLAYDEVTLLDHARDRITVRLCLPRHLDPRGQRWRAIALADLAVVGGVEI